MSESDDNNSVLLGYALSNHLGSIEVIPEVVTLAQTTIYRYADVLATCNEYGEGYKELIQKHIDAGTTHEALDEIEAELLKRRLLTYISSWVPEIIHPDEEEELKKFTFDSKSRSKEEKLPRKLKRGW